MITHVAIRLDDGAVWSLPRPFRNHNVIRIIAQLTGADFVDGEQGFLDLTGRFLTRDEAIPVAEASGQLGKFLIGSILTSEDLW